MKKIYLLFLVSFLLVSCWSQEIKWKVDETVLKVQNVKTEVQDIREKAQEIQAKGQEIQVKAQARKWIIEDTTEIINGYWDTLKGSVQDARTVKELYDSNNNDLQKDIQNAYK